MTPAREDRQGNPRRKLSWGPSALFLALFLLSLMAVGIGLGLKLSDFPVRQLKGDGPAGEIWGPREVGQGFLGRYPGLHRIDVLMATYARRNSHDLHFYLMSGPEPGIELFQRSFNAGEVRDNAYRSFHFPPLEESRGERFFFSLRSPDSSPGDAITVWATATDSYPQGSLYIGGTPAEGDLTFAAFYKGHPLEVIASLYQGLGENKPALWSSLNFTLLSLAYLVSFCLFGYWLGQALVGRRRADRSGSDERDARTAAITPQRTA